MEGKKYITNLKPGYSYKTKHYRRWLIYLGKYRTYKPEIGFKEYYAFLKDRKGPNQFILYSNLKKKFHLSGSQILKDVELYLNKLRSLLPEFNDISVEVIDFELIGVKEISLLELINKYKRYNKKICKDEISFNIYTSGIFFKESNSWNYLAHPDFYYKRIYNSRKIDDIKKLRDNLKYYNLYFNRYHKLTIDKNGAIKILPLGSKKYRRRIPTDHSLYYHDVDKIKIKFSNNLERIYQFTYHKYYYYYDFVDYNYEYNPICGLLKINEDLDNSS